MVQRNIAVAIPVNEICSLQMWHNYTYHCCIITPACSTWFFTNFIMSWWCVSPCFKSYFYTVFSRYDTITVALLHPCRTALDALLVEGLLAFTKVKKGSLDRWQLTRHRVEATVWFLLSIAFAIFIPDIGKVIQPLGGLAASFIFIFPGELWWALIEI